MYAWVDFSVGELSDEVIPDVTSQQSQPLMTSAPVTSSSTTSSGQLILALYCYRRDTLVDFVNDSEQYFQY